MSRQQPTLSATCVCDALAGEVRVFGVHARERLSELSEHVIELRAESVDLEGAPGTAVQLHVTDEHGRERHVHGVVERVELRPQAGGPLDVTLRVRPPHDLLRYRHGSRIFQELSVPEIVGAIFTDAGISMDHVRWSTGASYPVRPYCVQYEESEWNFVARLLEDEGIFYFFEHDAERVVMVLHDASERVEALEPATLTSTFDVGSGTASDARVWSWSEERRLVPAKVSLNDYDGLHPSRDLSASAERSEPHAREHYEFPGGHSVASEGARRAQLRLEEVGARRWAATASSDLLALAPGRRFELLDHPSASGEHVIVGTTWALSFGVGGAAERRIRLEMIPREQAFRPARRARAARIDGLQTAKVTGPAGEEIHCDEHGRVKVQFHWDRDGQRDELTTCWVRVAQPHTTGSVLVPRVGWEVLVQFEEGNPDRPIVLGHVFNAEHTPEVSLPAQKTVTSHRSASSPGAAALNEVSFDDAGGAQLVQLNAGRDLTTVAVHHKTMSTIGHVSRTVAADRIFSIGHDQTVSLGATYTDTVGCDQTITVGGTRTVRVNTAASEAVAGASVMDVRGLENVMVGTPISGVLQILEQVVIDGAQGAAASAASRAQAALLGPVAPVLETVKGSLGDASRYLGAAGAILGADNPAVALYGDALGAAEGALESADAGNMAGAMAAAAAGDAFAALAPPSVGSGAWVTNVAGDVKETIGMLASIATPFGVTFEVGGSNTESIGAARMAAYRGGYSESCAAKTETVGVYMIESAGGYAVDALGAIALNVASCSMQLGGGYSASTSGAVALTGSKLTLDAAEAVTLKCGSAEVIVDKDGVQLKGALSVSIEATGAAKIKPPSIGPM